MSVEKLFNSHPFSHLPGNQMAHSSQDKFHIAITIILVCLENTQTIKPRKEEGAKKTFG